MAIHVQASRSYEQILYLAAGHDSRGLHGNRRQLRQQPQPVSGKRPAPAVSAFPHPQPSTCPRPSTQLTQVGLQHHAERDNGVHGCDGRALQRERLPCPRPAKGSQHDEQACGQLEASGQLVGSVACADRNEHNDDKVLGSMDCIATHRNRRRKRTGMQGSGTGGGRAGGGTGGGSRPVPKGRRLRSPGLHRQRQVHEAAH